MKDKSKLEPWIWSIANNVSNNYRRVISKQKAMYVYQISDDLFYEDTYSQETEEIYDSLRTKISMFSEKYRNIIIFYYYDGLSIKEISEKLNIPEGTITWRLSEARNKLKKECLKMTETALRPVKLKLHINGNGNYNGKDRPFPTTYIEDALSQNILFNCYEEPKSVEDLAKISGVPAYYIEDRIDNLIKREAIIEPVKNKYQTNFIIFSDKHGIYHEENAEKILMPIMDKLSEALKNISEDINKIDFYKAEKSEKDLFYLYAILAFSYCKNKYCTLPEIKIPEKYDGNCFSYCGTIETGNHFRASTGGQRSSIEKYSHSTYYFLKGHPYRQMMYDTYINTCIDVITTGTSNDKYELANAIKDGYIIKRDNDELFVPIPFITYKIKTELKNIFEKHIVPLMDEYQSLVMKYISGYKKMFPKHLSNDINFSCREIYLGLLSVVIDYMQNNGAIEPPTPNSYCEVLIEYRK